MDISFLQKNYFVVVLVVIFSMIYTTLVNLVTPDKKSDYIKDIILSVIISGVMVYIHTLEIPIEDISLGPVPF
jgi:hypothetical protein